ncbi:hypothetical protein WJX81_005970 [Elliptochloris bilobata]|uniref:Uncharacterized protein n=1 Tax=Elliptochloris bilobata TaxID=381761 RepID=A0AAW1R1J3_9CHLO
MAFQNTVASTPYNTIKLPDTLSVKGARFEGRGYEHFRNIFMQPGMLSQAAGSAYVEFGNTKIMAGVYGPRESDRREAFSNTGRLQCDVKLATLATRQRGRFGQSDQEREMSAALVSALSGAVRRETFPKASVDVYAVVLEADGGELAVAATAAALALADAGIELSDLVSACNVSRVDGQLLLDPSAGEARRQDGSAMMAMMPATNLVTHLELTGTWSAAQATEVLQLCMGGCLQLDLAMRASLRQTAPG